MSSLSRSLNDSSTRGDPTGRLTSREYDYFLYYQFIHRDPSEEFGLLREKATNGWQVQAGMAMADRECDLTFSGRVPLNNEAMLEHIKCTNHNAFFLTTCPGSIFYPLSDEAHTPSPYYTYTFKAKAAHFPGPRGKKVYFVDTTTIMWTPLPLTTPIVRHVFAHCVTGKKLSALRELMAQQLANQSSDRIYRLEDLQRLLGENMREVSAMIRIGEIKRLFFHSIMEPLYRYYDVTDLEYVSIGKLSYMSKIVTEKSGSYNPSLLCYQSMCSADHIVCRDKDKMWFLPELTLEQYVDICTRKEYDYTTQDYAALRIYSTLKSLVHLNGCTCVEYEELLTLAAVTDREVAKKAMFLLTDAYEAVVVEEKRRSFFQLHPGPAPQFVYRKEDYVHEEIIIHSIDSAIQTFIKSPPHIAPSEVAAAYPMLPKNEICSEQMLMLEYIRTLPVPIVKGPGGTGKSELLSHALGMVDAITLFQETKFVTYQANNASEAAKRNTPFATTCHRLMAKHFSKCAHSPRNRANGVTPLRPSTPNRCASLSSSSSSMSRPVVRIPSVSSILDSDSGQHDVSFEEEEEDLQGDSEFGVFHVCPLENVTRLILDEAGLMYEGLISAVLHVLTTCGKLSQIIICGDDRQQVQMQPGDFQRAMFKGFAPWTLEFTHMHRFKSSAASILAHNANAIDEMKPENLIIEPKVWEFIPLEKQYYNTRNYQGKEELRQELMEHFKRIGFSDDENSMLVTRTHELRNLAMSAVEEIQYGNVIPNSLRVNQKILCKDTIKELGVVARKIYVLLRIEDCHVPPKRTLKSIEAKEYAGLKVHKVSFDDTITTHKPRGMCRRLVVRELGEKPSTDGNYKEIILPYDQKYRGRVIKASSITERACQGSEANFIVCLKPTFWAKADFKETFYVVATRPRERFVILSQHKYITQWAKNPSPPRETRLAEKLEKLYRVHSLRFDVPTGTADIMQKRQEEEESGIYELKRFG